MKLEDIVNGAIGPFDEYCDGYGTVGANGLGYISVLKIETGIVKADMDEVLEGIVSYDRAESNGTYVGQINMIAASSFNGLNGAVWGYHLAKHESIHDDSIKPMFMRTRSDGVEIPVYSVDPLLNAGERFFGTAEKRRFPILPGAHVSCAVKSATVKGPSKVWCAIAIAIADDREKDSNLFIEDAGEGAVDPQLCEKIATSVVRCGDDNKVKYKAIFVGFKEQDVPAGYVGCSLTCAPYVVFAKNALKGVKKPADLLKMTVADWEKSTGY